MVLPSSFSGYGPPGSPHRPSRNRTTYCTPSSSLVTPVTVPLPNTGKGSFSIGTGEATPGVQNAKIPRSHAPPRNPIHPSPAESHRFTQSTRRGDFQPLPSPQPRRQRAVPIPQNGPNAPRPALRHHRDGAFIFAVRGNLPFGSGEDDPLERVLPLGLYRHREEEVFAAVAILAGHEIQRQQRPAIGADPPDAIGTPLFGEAGFGMHRIHRLELHLTIRHASP